MTDDPGTGAPGDGTAIIVAGRTCRRHTHEDGERTFQPGSTVTYTITINNTGDTASGDNAGDELTDVLPAS